VARTSPGPQRNGDSVEGFGVSLDRLNEINNKKDMEALHHYGDVGGLAQVLGSDLKHGLRTDQLEKSRSVFGKNETKHAPPKKFLVLCWETIQDPVIILLIIAAAISTIIGAAIPSERAHNGWIEGVAIWVAVLVVTCVGAGNDWQKDRQFRKLYAQKEIITVKMVRDGQQVLVGNTEVVVGDVLLLDTGDKVIADCIVIESFGLVIDEASLTGEADPIKKNSHDDPWVRSGTQVNEGSARLLVVAVGENSEWGKTMALMEDAGDDETPLQESLEIIATAVGKVGAGVAVACFIALLIKWCVEKNGFPIDEINSNGPVQFFLYAVTIVVVAVPEGLPLAVTISLAYSMKKMMKDNNFVRVLSACETMGGATAICSDKTGTLTENRMTVVEGWLAGTKVDRTPSTEDLKPALARDLAVNISISSKAFLVEEGQRIEFVGNRTECALLMLLKKLGIDYRTVREEEQGNLTAMFGFSSAKKMSSCVVKAGNVYKVYNKGAAEWVLAKCTSEFTPSGDRRAMTEARREELLNIVTEMASRGLRCICLTVRELPLEDPKRPADFFETSDHVDEELTALAIVGIKDPVRPEVPDAVATCQRAGITVRMVTGDNIHTARHIARECGILPPNTDFMAMEGPTFRNMDKEELVAQLPKLRVLARSSPEDKLTLVNMLKQQGEVVAVTGDGTNDAPALKESDVGLAMGIAGTEVAKEAADIIILDDNFSSIVKSVLWGRSVFNNIRKFLQFQLTVNFVALVTAFVGAIVGGHEPLNVLQLLWVNLIMDSLGALALATENPNPELLLEKPHGRDEALISRNMWLHIIGQGIYQLFWMFFTLYALPALFDYYRIQTREEYYKEECTARLSAPTYNATQTQLYCNWATYCGMPEGDRNSDSCQLYTSYWKQNGGSTPDDDRTAICRTATDCSDWTQFSTAKDNLQTNYDDVEKDQAMKSLSMLFNCFIMMQVANEICARRINNEYTIFHGILQSPIFLTVIVVTLGLQAIIINLLGMFFKVNPLTWHEWLVSMAVGAGIILWSFMLRFFARMWQGTHQAKQVPAAGAAPSNVQLIVAR